MGPPGSWRPQKGPMMAPWTLLSGVFIRYDTNIQCFSCPPLGAMPRKTPWHGVMRLAVVCLICEIKHLFAAVRINLSGSNYTFVPQNITENVTHLVMTHNYIAVLDNTSFAKYRDLQQINLGNNKIEYILPGTFDNNRHLKKLKFGHCKIKYLPPSFGPSAPFITDLDLSAAIPSSSIWIIRGKYLAQFSSLTYLRLKYLSLYTIEDIFLPRFFRKPVTWSHQTIILPQCICRSIPCSRKAEYTA